MTMIVNPNIFTSKAALKVALDKGLVIYEPTPWGDNHHDSRTVPVGWNDVVTNHPVRSKFARIEKRADGWKVS